jgi:hemerythrin
MALIVWKPTYSVGVPEMDDQHKRLVEILNELNEGLVKGQGKDKLYSTLMGLIDYTKKHFADEEKLMEKSGYPKLDQHKKEHKELTQQVVDFARQYNAGEKGITIELMNFLRSWLVVHIQGKDAEYGRHINENS